MTQLTRDRSRARSRPGTGALQALVYVRQSSLQQVHDHPESRARQYAWPITPSPSAGRPTRWW